MEDKLTIAIIEGSARVERQSLKAARFVEQIGRTLPGVEVIFVDPRDFDFKNDGHDAPDKDPRFTEITAKADGFFIVMPEYNHSYPGSLKRMLDLEYANYRHKPVALAGVSDGPWGGARGVENLLPALRAIGLMPSQLTTYFPMVKELFDEAGGMKPAEVDRYTKSIQSQFADLLWLAKALKWGRQQDA